MGSSVMKSPSLQNYVACCLATVCCVLAPTATLAAESALLKDLPTPTVAAKRAGRLLTLSCELRNADGSQYRPKNQDDYNNPPRFAVYQGDQMIGSGAFEYG